MSSYNSGRHGGRGGRGYRNKSSNGRGNRTNNKDFKATNKKKTLEDYYFYVGSAKQASNYESAAYFIINHIKKEYDRGRDIAEPLRELKKTRYRHLDAQVKRKYQEKRGNESNTR
jgi:hypothetical protein